MPPAAKKDVMWIIFDLKSSNKDLLLEGLLKVVTHKMLQTNDICHILLSNSIHTSNAREVPNVLRTDVDEMDPQIIYQCINGAEVSDMPSTDFLDVLLLAIHYVKQANGMAGVVNKQIIYFTDLEDQVLEEEGKSMKLSEIVKELNENEIFLYIVGPDATLPNTLVEPNDVRQSMKKLMVDETNDALVAAKDIVQQTERSVLCNIQIGTSIIHFFRKSQGSQPWLVPISIGNELTIPTKTVKIFNQDTDISLEDKDSKDAGHSDVFLLEEDESIELPFKDLIKGVICHGKFVGIDDEDMFKFETERAFDLVGFTESKFVPEAYVEGNGTFHVLPAAEPDNEGYELFLTLVKVLAQDEKYAIMQRIYNKNNYPKYFVLKPEPEANPPRFVMTSLPYADDVVGRNFKVSKPQKLDVKVEEDDFLTFCKSIDICDDSCTVEWPLAPSMAMEHLTDNIAKATARKLCGRDFEFIQTDAFDLEKTVDLESFLLKEAAFSE